MANPYPFYIPKVRDWKQSAHNVHFLNDECRDYFVNVMQQMKRLDLAMGNYYRFTLDVLTWAPAPPLATSVDPNPRPIITPYRDVKTSQDARFVAIADALEFIKTSLSEYAVNYMATPAEEEVGYTPHLPGFVCAKLRSSPGPFELELLSQLAYLGRWGNHDNRKQTRVVLSPDFCDSKRKLSFAFSIDEWYYDDKVKANTWKSILHGGLIYSGPHPDSPLVDRELDDHQHKWPKVWSVHT